MHAIPYFIIDLGTTLRWWNCMDVNHAQEQKYYSSYAYCVPHYVMNPLDVTNQLLEGQALITHPLNLILET